MNQEFFSTTKHFAKSLVLVASVLMLVGQSSDAQDDWQRWRGPTGNGIAAKGQKPPVRWSKDKNVVWKSKVPGRGHSSPIVVANKIFLTTAESDSKTQSVLCYDRASGKQLWKTKINEGGFIRMHANNSQASPTVATDGEKVYAVFCHHDATEAIALDMDGEIKWRTTVGDFRPRYPFGFGASPIIYDSKLLVPNESMANGGIVALDTKNGEVVSKIDRGELTSYSTPVVVNLGDKDHLFIGGGNAVKSYDPKTGDENWAAQTRWIVSCGTIVWDDEIVFASGGFPAQQTLAMDYKTGDVLWSNSVKVYEQSLLAVDGYLYAHADNGGIYCWRASDGKEMWKVRFKTSVSVSPTLANGHIYFTSQSGDTLVIKQTPKGYEEVAKNKLGDSAFASPAICGNQIFARVGDGGQEYLYCIGE